MLFSGCSEKGGQRQRFWRFYNGLQTQASLNGWSSSCGYGAAVEAYAMLNTKRFDSAKVISLGF
jgi:hypothetical protein